MSPGEVTTAPLVEIQQTFDVRFSYPVCLTRGVFHPGNPTLRRVLQQGGPGRHRLLLAIDSGVLRSDGRLISRVERYSDANQDVITLVGRPLLVRGGEVCKSDATEVEALYSLVARHQLCRHSFVLAIGGGAVLDVVGFAAATAHRGLRLIRMPTTVLSQNDAGIGVKNAINLYGRKNFVGTCAPPFAVINDFDFLRALSARELRAGIAEAVKVALIKDRHFFDRLDELRGHLARFEWGALEEMIVRCAKLHLRHIRTSGDPFELGSARPLDFGHWAAHKLEELSRGALRHGEAVAIGVALDSVYSHQVGMLGETQLHAILTLLEDVGFELHHPALSALDVEMALAHFREHLGGALSITLLQDIGSGVAVSEIDVSIMCKCVHLLMQRGDERSC